MTAFLTWYVILTLLGWLTFPLVYYLFPALTDRGYTLSRAAGLLIWGYIFWLLASLGIAQNDLGGILLALALLVGLSAWSVFNRKSSIINRKSEIINFLQSNKSIIFTTEILFFIAFAFLAFVRSANPELQSTEKPMELMFINSILRSETFPPQDAWLSGYAISYYYFGYVMNAMLAKLSNINGSTAHNLMTSLIFALSAISSYGILYNLLSKNGGRESEIINRKSQIGNAFLAPLFLLLLSNFEALLEILHKRRLFWTENSSFWSWLKNIDSKNLFWQNDVATFNFWTWLDMKELSQTPNTLSEHTFQYWWELEKQTGGSFWFVNAINNWFTEQFMPERYLWWWRASRVIQDYDMTGGFREVIDEFPFFSFLLGDLHPHVLAIPFSLLAISAALNLFLGGWRGEINIFGARLHVNVAGFLFSALVVGGLSFLNTWDILIAASLIVTAYVISRASEDGWNWKRLEDAFVFALPLGILSVILYFPFYLGFSSQAGGILPNFMYPTRGAHVWVMWGTLLIPIFTYLIYSGVRQQAAAQTDSAHRASELSDPRVKPNWKLGISLSLGLTLTLLLLTFSIGLIGAFIEKDFVLNFLASQSMTASQYILASSLRRLTYIGSLITLLAVLIPTLAFLFPHYELYNPEAKWSGPITNYLLAEKNTNSSPSDLQLSTFNPSTRFASGQRLPSPTFILILITFGALLILAPEFVYLRDNFGYRINTVFKFYYQAWILLSLAAAFGVSVLLQNLRGFMNIIFRILIGLVIFSGLLYPALSLLTKTNNFNPTFGYTLNDFERFQRENPDEAAAIEFLLTAPAGILAEAVGDGYSGYARISMYTGLQTLLGWPGHEAQWRGSYAPQGSRREDITKLYVTARWEEAQLIIDQYNIRYIYIGTLERVSMPVNEEKFKSHLKPIFQQGNVIIYEAP